MKNEELRKAYTRLDVLTQMYREITLKMIQDEIDWSEGIDQKAKLFEKIEEIQDEYEIDLDTYFDEDYEEYEELDFLGFPEWELETYEKLMNEWAAA